MWKFILCLLVICVALLSAEAKYEENKLIKKLLAKYERSSGKLARPVEARSDQLNVQMGLSLIRASLDEKTGIVTATAWMTHNWRDNLVSWDAEKTGIPNVRVPTKDLWMPDIVLFNSIGAVTYTMDPLAVVSADGHVSRVQPTTMQIECSESGGSYQCPFKFGSWTYDGNLQDMNFYSGEAIDVSHYSTSSVWRVTGNTAKKNVKYYPCCAEPYPDLTFNLELTKSD